MQQEVAVREKEPKRDRSVERHEEVERVQRVLREKEEEVDALKRERSREAKSRSKRSKVLQVNQEVILIVLTDILFIFRYKVVSGCVFDGVALYLYILMRYTRIGVSV